jgi:hypothetical protein
VYTGTFCERQLAHPITSPKTDEYDRPQAGKHCAGEVFMDRLLSTVSYLVIACTIMFHALAAISSEPQIRVGVVSGVEREIGVSDGQLKGRFSSYYQCVFSHLDNNFKYIEMPLAQLLFQLRNGGVAIGLPLVQTSDRDTYADFGGLLFQTEYVYLMLKSLPPLSQTTGLTYAFVRRFVGEELMRGEQAKLLPVSEWRQAVDTLKRDRADVVVLPWVLVDQLMANYESDYFVRTAEWVDISMYVSHAYGDSQLTANVRRAVRECWYRNDVEE